MAHPICIFEDSHYSQLFPLSLTRPVFDLRCGILTLKEKVINQFLDNSVGLFCRNYLKDLVQQDNPDRQVNKVDADVCLFINGRLIVDSNSEKLFDTSDEKVYLYKGQVVAALLKGANMAEFVKLLESNSDLLKFSSVSQVELENIHLINYPWDLVNENPSEIAKDFNYFSKGGIIEGSLSEHAVLVNKSHIYIGRDSVIKPGAILDADEGPVFIGEGASIMHNAVIEGPAFVGNRSVIKIATKIYAGTSIGEVCKVGGEVGESIIHSYSNKQHDGFLGHAYLGQWVNLGADTNNSDLNNNYGNIKVFVNGSMIDSGSMFVGLFMGDHSKSGINTMFNSGTAVGTMCNVYGAGFPPKFIPSFSWGGSDGIVEHDFEKALETARRVMVRRKKDLSSTYEKIFRHVFDSTRDERNQ